MFVLLFVKKALQNFAMPCVFAQRIAQTTPQTNFETKNHYILTCSVLQAIG